jgi:hypothetical protein
MSNHGGRMAIDLPEISENLGGISSAATDDGNPGSIHKYPQVSSSSHK